MSEQLAKKRQSLEEMMLSEPPMMSTDSPSNQGLEHLEKDDLSLPRLVLAQKNSPQLEEDDPSYIENLQYKEFFNSLTGYRYGTELKVAILQSLPPRHVLFRAWDEGGGVLDPNVPPDDPRTQFGEDGEPPEATKFYDYVVRVLDSQHSIEFNDVPEVMSLSFKNTSLKVARQLNSMLKLRNKPIYWGIFTLRSKSATSAKGTYAIPTVQNCGWCNEKLILENQQLFESLKSKDLVIDRENEQEPDVEDSF